MDRSQVHFIFTSIHTAKNLQTSLFQAFPSDSEESDTELTRMSESMARRSVRVEERAARYVPLVWFTGCLLGLLVAANIVCLITTTRKVDEMYTVLIQLMEFYNDD